MADFEWLLSLSKTDYLKETRQMDYKLICLKKRAVKKPKESKLKQKLKEIEDGKKSAD